MKTRSIIVTSILSAGICFPGAAQILTVNSANSQPVSTSFSLSYGQTYLVRAEGTFIYNTYLTDGNTFKADAEWSWNQLTQDGTWIERFPYADRPDYYLDLIINGQGINIDWLGTPDLTPGPNSVFTAHTYSPSHVYETQIIGQGAPVSFMIYDIANYSDNSGSLTVTISEVPEPATAGLLFLGVLGLIVRMKRV